MTIREQTIERALQAAFPENTLNVPPEDAHSSKYQGVTVLEYFTVEAMKILAAAPGSDVRTPVRQREIAETAVEMAMIQISEIQKKLRRIADGEEE